MHLLPHRYTQLDVYAPSTTGMHPIIFFQYGGGFVQGARQLQLPAPADLGYGNVGAFFAARGFVTVIADYRLAPAVKYPAPAEDVRDAIAWVLENTDKLGVEVDKEKIFLVAHSAGAAHALTLLLHPSLLAAAPAVKNAVKAAVIVSAPFHPPEGPADPAMTASADAYYGSVDAYKANSPLTLLKANPDAGALPPVFIVQGENDPEWFISAGKEFVKEAGEKAKKYFVAEGHNHISLTWALGADEKGEAWAEEAAEWLKGF
ncbi:Esterase lipase thioesterase family protein [Mycena kentingensis (nom. inval.)]|nr:Esterase lipase thioesterase family protein [Mycena kentingensis (nom. inval.)]